VKVVEEAFRNLNSRTGRDRIHHISVTARVIRTPGTTIQRHACVAGPDLTHSQREDTSLMTRAPDDLAPFRFTMGNQMKRIVLFLLLASAPTLHAADVHGKPAKPVAHTTLNLDGWTVHIDNRLLAGGPDADLGQRAIRLLGDRLFAIKLVVSADKVQRLQQVPIWLDRSHGNLKPMQYHPSAGWLLSNGYSTNLAKCVHIPDAEWFMTPEHYTKQPWAVLHELAHAYHDQVLGFDHAGIKVAWKHVVDSGHFDSVLHIFGHKEKHYAPTNQKEFFAEMTEAYFGVNDFYPFNRAELKQAEPEVLDLLRNIWEATAQP